MRSTGAVGAIAGISLILSGCAAVAIEEPLRPEVAGSKPAPPELLRESGGSLRLEQLSVVLRSGDVEVRVTPLDQRVVRLAAPDARHRLHRLAGGFGGQRGDRHSLFLVTFLAHTPNQRVAPTDLRFESGGRQLMNVELHPITANWDERGIPVREPVAAVYVVGEIVDPFAPFQVRYAGLVSDGWREVIPLLQAETLRIGDGRDVPTVNSRADTP